MPRAVIYSRFSTDLQNEKSIEDQEAIARIFAEKNGYEVIKTYSDAAQSGASIFGRQGLLDLMEAAKHKFFDVVIVEELDRLSRDMEDLAGIHKRLSFLDIDIVAIHEGTASTVTVGLRGLVGQLFREDNARKVRRGLQGKVKAGLSAGGQAFGYKADPLNKGKLIIVPEEAQVVVRIYEDYAEGKSPKAIAHALNAENAPAPRGARWNSSALYGWEQRGSGILRNHLYAGQIVWNKIKMVKDPETGKRVSRSNPSSDWHTTDVPELRIVEQSLFEKVQELIKPTRQPAAITGGMKRPKRLLSGLLKCGSCGAGISTKGKDRSGRVRVQCSAHVESRSCSNPQTFYLDTIEDLVLDTLRAELANPKKLVNYVTAYNAARQEYAHKLVQRRSTLEKRIKELDVELDRLVDHIAKGIGKPERIAVQMEQKEAEFDAAKAELALEPEPVDLVALHPATIQKYEQQLNILREELQRRVDHGYPKAAEVMRSLIDSIVVTRNPTTGKGLAIQIRGKLRKFLETPKFQKLSGGGLVAKEGFEPPTQGL